MLPHVSSSGLSGTALHTAHPKPGSIEGVQYCGVDDRKKEGGAMSCISSITVEGGIPVGLPDVVGCLLF